MKTTKIIISLSIAFLFLSCSEKEGVVGSRQRLDEVMVEEVETMGGVVIYERPSSVGEKWNWDGDELYRIDYSDECQYSEIFFYDSRNRISHTMVPAYKLDRMFHYDGRKLSYIECLYDGKLYCTILFRHDDKHITGMDWQYESDAGKDVTNVSYDFVWNGNNVSRIVCTAGLDGWECEATYDDNYNPYHQLFGNYELESRFWGFATLSENNVRSLKIINSDGEERNYQFEYKYNKHYPSECVMTSSYRGADLNTLEETVYTMTKKRIFSYL